MAVMFGRSTDDAIPRVGDMIFPEHTHICKTTRHGLIHSATRNIVEIQRSDITRVRMNVNSIGYHVVKKRAAARYFHAVYCVKCALCSEIGWEGRK